MRVGAATVVIFAALSYAGDCPEKESYKGWERDNTVYVEFTLEAHGQIKTQGLKAMDLWTKENETNGTRVRFALAGPANEPNIVVGTGPIDGFTPAATLVQVVDGRIAEATVIFDLNSPNWDRHDILSYGPGLMKAMLHELGHTLGLAHPKDQDRGASVMNGYIGANDKGNHIADAPTPCDRDMMKKYYNAPTPGQGGGGPGSRPRPANMPVADICPPCVISVPQVEGPSIPVFGFCCGNGAGNPNGPRSPNTPPSFAFINTGYTCSLDGWRQLTCAADLCCVHPDDFPPGSVGAVNPGTSCAAQGWYEHNQCAECEASSGGTCVKKETCGPGACMPWPHYCWKPPYAPTPEPTDPPPPGRTCSDMTWYGADAHDQCVADHGSCTKKQDCGGGPCQPWPHYCWMPN